MERERRTLQLSITKKALYGFRPVAVNSLPPSLSLSLSHTHTEAEDRPNQ